MLRLTPPDGYGVIRVAPKQWVAVQSEIFVDAQCPDDWFGFSSVLDQQTWKQERYATRNDAVIACFLHQEDEAMQERLRMEAFAVRCELHPDRCSWYRDEIAAITGDAPTELVTGKASVYVSPYVCPAGQGHCMLACSGPTIEDALRIAVEKVYASQHACGCLGLVAADGMCDGQCLPIYEEAF